MPAAPSRCRDCCARRKARPSTELQHFLTHGSKEQALRKDETLNHIHWATTRRAEADQLFAFAIDHRRQLEEIADRAGAARERIGDFKRLAVAATAKVANGAPGFGMLLDETYGRAAMADAAKHDFWIGRPMEVPGSRPLRFEFSQDAGSRLIEWPIGHTIKCLAFYHPDDDAGFEAANRHRNCGCSMTRRARSAAN